jgi:hypothetical protein
MPEWHLRVVLRSDWLTSEVKSFEISTFVHAKVPMSIQPVSHR